jgi:hypothetical protein
MGIATLALRLGLAIALGALMVASPAAADDGGASFWTPGQYASFAATQTDPGWSVGLETYLSKGSSPSGVVTDARNGIRVSGRVLTQAYEYVVPGYTFDGTVLGGQLYLGATFGYAWINNKADSVLEQRDRKSIVTIQTNIDELGWGTTDINPLATLKWNVGDHNFMVYATGNVPTGYYDKTVLGTPGLGFWAIDGGLGYTYDNDKGLEFSVVAGMTYNFEDPTTQYQSGVDGHIDVGASYLIADPFYVGAAGYLFHQLTPDVGAPADLGWHISKVAGAGPQLGWSWRSHGLEVDVNLRGYAEFAAQNRPEGYAAWFTVTLSQVKPKATK